MPCVESKLFRVIYLCGLKSQKTDDLKKKTNKIDGTEKQAKQNKEKQPILQVMRVHQNRQPDQMSKYLHSDT